jgi:very-short-patch-repair endonuclease
MSRMTKIAGKLRRNQTDAERKIWALLRSGEMGFKFRRQHPIGRYIADFICLERRLIVELDGGQHTEANDTNRTEFLESVGYQVLRFANNEVMANPEGVFQMIQRVLHTPHPSPLPQGERGF